MATSGSGVQIESGIDFTTVVLSIRESVLLMLGRVAAADKEQVDLAGAHSQIEILRVLLDKTHGNLTEDEDRLLRTVIYELRTAYVETSRNR